MILQKNAHPNVSHSYAKLQCAALALQQTLREKPELVTAIVDAVMRHQKSFYELQNLREQDMEGLYATAYDCYLHKHYEAAAVFFETLAFYSCFDLRGWIGLAASLEQQQRFSEAILCHWIHDQLSFEDSFSLFYTHDCYVVIHKIAQTFSSQQTKHPDRSCYQEKKRQQQNW
ncbi:MAG: hypothetical protein FJ390_03800 [Verrucomicrobia bacterium]|nr:hypothetical protein [Verrucomicrobiota bacterium]